MTIALLTTHYALNLTLGHQGQSQTPGQGQDSVQVYPFYLRKHSRILRHQSSYAFRIFAEFCILFADKNHPKCLPCQEKLLNSHYNIYR